MWANPINVLLATNGQVNLSPNTSAALSGPWARAEKRAWVLTTANAEVSKTPRYLAQKWGQLQPSIAVLPPENMGQLAYFGPT